MKRVSTLCVVLLTVSLMIPGLASAILYEAKFIEQPNESGVKGYVNNVLVGETAGQYLEISVPQFTFITPQIWYVNMLESNGSVSDTILWDFQASGTIIKFASRNVSMKMRHWLREFSVVNPRFP